MEILPYNKAQYFSDSYALWQLCFEPLWSMNPKTFEARLFPLNTHTKGFRNFVAIDNSNVVGFVSSQSGGDNQGGILCIAVHKNFRKQGIGSQLLKTAISALTQEGINKIGIGSGGASYLWPGVPENLPYSKHFFEKHGWNFPEKLYDMTLDLTEFKPNNHWIQQAEAAGYRIQQISKEHIESLLKLLSEEQPGWLSSYQHLINRENFKNILVAANKTGVVGVVSLFDYLDEERDTGMVWADLLTEKLGGFGCLYVKNDLRESGVGRALSEFATQTLCDRGVKVSLLGWTYLEDFYGKLGYKIWRNYWISDRPLCKRMVNL